MASMHTRMAAASSALGVALLAAHVAFAQASDPWAIPAEGSCDAPASGGPADAVPKPFHVGDVLDREKSAVLERFVPEELWAHRDRFFYDGMQLEIGPCYRDCSPPEFFARATEQFRGRARLGPDGELESYQAGLPFAPDTIDPNDPR